MKSINYLDEIVKRKRSEIEPIVQAIKVNPDHYLNDFLSQKHPLSNRFSAALKKQHLAVIAEVKRKSPSLGEIRAITNPVALALEYCQGGASAISVLTDFEGFGGTLNDLQQISQAVGKEFPNVPILRKDFIIHPLQLAEAALAGASAVLLIASILGEDLKTFIREAIRLGLETLTEVHDLDDLKLAIGSGAPIIGVNHRNLKTFEIDLSRSEIFYPLIPSHIITVAESGIHSLEQAKRMRDLHYDAILVGESLVRSQNPSELIKNMKGEKS